MDDEKYAALSDYELYHVIDRSNFTTNKPAGPVRWMAPELSSGDDEDDKPHFTTATDIFAFAMTVIEVLTYQVLSSIVEHEGIFPDFHRRCSFRIKKAGFDCCTYDIGWSETGRT